MYTWYVAHNEFESCLLGGGIGPHIYSVLCQGKPSVPVILVIVDKDA